MTTLTAIDLNGNCLEGTVLFCFVLFVVSSCAHVLLCYAMLCYRFLRAGSVPNSFCNLGGLDLIDFAGIAPPLACFPACMSTVTTLASGGATEGCPTDQENGLCGFIAATDIQVTSGYSQWACDVSGYPSTDPCAGGAVWPGLTCAGAAVPTGVDFDGVALSGSLPSAIGCLVALTKLGISNSNITGNDTADYYPYCSALNPCPFFSCMSIGTIPLEVGGLSALSRLTLSISSLHGTIPDALYNMSTLTILDLRENSLNGTIPSAVASLAALTRLRLGKNSLTGTLPSALGCLSNLALLSLIHNKFEGSIPDTVGQLSLMTALYLHHNSLTGTLPHAFGCLTQIEILYLGHNLLNGTIPPYCCLAFLSILTLSNCSFVGTVPSGMWFIPTLTRVALDGNSFTGTVQCDAWTVAKRLICSRVCSPQGRSIRDHALLFVYCSCRLSSP